MLRRVLLVVLAGIVAAPFSALSDEQIVKRKVVTSDAEDEEVVAETEIERTEIESRDAETSEAGEQQAGESDSTEIAQERTVVRQKEVVRGGLDDQVIGIIPQAGILVVGDGTGENSTRAVGGMTFDINALSGVPTARGKPFLGPSLGVFYSHLGRPGGNFFGVNSPSGDGGTDLLLLPLNAKLGYTFGERVRLSVRGGATIMYQDTSFGTGAITARDSDWDTQPNVGADLELGLGKNVLLLIRPDWVLRDGPNFFTGTLGIGFPLS